MRHTASAAEAPSAVTHGMEATQVACAGLEQGERSDEAGSDDSLAPPAIVPGSVFDADIPPMSDIDAMDVAIAEAFSLTGPMPVVVHTAPVITMAR